MQYVRLSNTRIKSAGFTLFEMVVVICCIVILYRVAEQRLNLIPAAAERASYYAILDQVKIGVSFEMYTRLTNRDQSGLMELEGTNPMALLLEAPNNYRGELEAVTDRNVDKRSSWYFEKSTGELVYVVGSSSIENVFVDFGNVAVNYGQIRLRLSNIYSNGVTTPGIRDAEMANGRWQALLLQPVREYQWLKQEDLSMPI